jgi:hypothetical protein
MMCVSDKLFKEIRDLNFEVVGQVDSFLPHMIIFSLYLSLSLSLSRAHTHTHKQGEAILYKYLWFPCRSIFLISVCSIADFASKSNIHAARLHRYDNYSE